MENKKTNSESYNAGYDAGFNGPNTTNCHFSYFSDKKLMKEWERGNTAGKAAKDNPCNDNDMPSKNYLDV